MLHRRDLGLDVDPYSLRATTPEQIAQQLAEIMTQQLIPMAQILAAQGKTVDVGRYLEIVAQRLNLPELNEVITSQESLYEEQAAQQEMAGPAETERSYVRYNVPQMTRAGHDMQMMQIAQGQAGEDGAERLEG